MALSRYELEQLTTSITEGILRGMDRIPDRIIGQNGNVIDLTQDVTARQNYINNILNQKKDAYEADLIRQMEEIQRGIHSDSEAARKKLDEIADALDRSRNGGISQRDVDNERARARGAKLQKTAAIIGAITKIAEGFLDIYVAIENRRLEVTKADIEYRTKITEAAIDRNSKVVSQGMRMITGGFTKNAVQLSFDATESAYDLAQTSVRTSQEMRIAGLTYAKDVKAANSKMIGGVLTAGAGIGAAIGSIIPGIGTAAGVAVGAIIGAIGGLLVSAWNKLTGIEIKQMELGIQKAEAVSKIMQSTMEQFKQITKPWDDLAKSVTEFLLNVNDAGRRFSVTIGHTGNTLASTITAMPRQIVGNNTLARIFGKEVEKIPEYMDSYMTASERNVGLSAKDLGNMMATGRLFGMSTQESTQLYGSMNIFNTSVSSAADSMGVMYHQLTRMGLSGKKFTKDLVQNLKLAQKYNFKGGVDNMMKLTKWAQQTRFNLNSAASFADSILEGTLSEALEKSARLQVLGGAAAIYSDPLGMLYDAGANVGDLARRQAAMFSDLTGKFNTKTGETEFNNWYENKMIRERAKAAGLNVEDVFNQIRQTNKQGVIDKLLSGMDEEDRIAIGNRATYNKKKNRWEVTDIKGNVHDIQEYKDNKAKIEDLLPKDTQESILKVAEKSLSELAKLNNTVEDNMTKLANSRLAGEIFWHTKLKRELTDDFYKEHWDGVVNAVSSAEGHTMRMFMQTMNMMTRTADDTTLIDNIYGGIENLVTELYSGETYATLLEASDAFYKGSASFADWAEKLLAKEEREEFNKNAQKAYDRAAAYNPTTTNESVKILTSIAEDGMGTDPWWMQALKWFNVGMSQAKDGTGYTNGGIMLGASNVKSINDGAVNVKTAKRDQYLVAQTGGPIDILLKQLLPGLQALLSGNGGSNNVNLNLNGRLELSQDGSSVNLVELIKNDPAMATKFLAVLQKTMEVNQNGRAIRNRMIS